MMPQGGIDPAADEVNAIVRAMIPAAAKLQDSIGALIMIVLGWWCCSVEVFVRYDFGERYLSVMRLFLAGCIMLVLLIPSVFSLPAMLGIVPVSLFSIFFLSFIGLSVLHQTRIKLRYRNRIPWHSMSCGISRLADLNLPYVGDDDWALYRWYEPVTVFLVGLFFGLFEYTLGIWLVVSAAALFMRNQMYYFQYRARILDIIDATLDAQFLNDVALGTDKRNQAGISGMPVVWPVMPNKNLSSPNEGSPDIAKTVASTLNMPNEVRIPQDTTANVMDFAATVATTLDTPEDDSPQDDDKKILH